MVSWVLGCRGDWWDGCWVFGVLSLEMTLVVRVSMAAGPSVLVVRVEVQVEVEGIGRVWVRVNTFLFMGMSIMLRRTGKTGKIRKVRGLIEMRTDF